MLLKHIDTCETSSGEMCPDWGPQYLKDVDMVEQVQRMATKIIKGMEHMRRMERLIAEKVESGSFERCKAKGHEL